MIDTNPTKSWIVLSYFPYGFRRLRTLRRWYLPLKQSPLDKPPSFKTAAAL